MRNSYMRAQSPVSVIEPISPAIDRVRLMLFEPFDLTRWFIVGFCAWLANLTIGRGNPNFVLPHRRGPLHFESFQPADLLQQVKDYIVYNLSWIIIIGLVATVLLIILWLVFTWLSSRGRFMFLHCVAHNRAEVRVPWKKFARHARSLFLFRIVLGLIGFAATVLLTLAAILLVLVLRARTGSNHAAIYGLVLAFLPILALTILFLLIHKFTRDFVVPIMFLRTPRCLDAWREFLTLLSANAARFTLYVLFQILIFVAIWAIIMVATLATCCCAGIILAIPYIGTVLILPLLVFVRAYSLSYLAQFSPALDVFTTAIPQADPPQSY
jgi:hypothetical protein